MKSSQAKDFVHTIIEWDRDIDRDMPWQGEKDPYLIWLSEVLLQQTRVEQGRPYYINFKTNYPTVFDLAAAPDDDVLRLWQGLGYYSRCRNLLIAARYIVDVLEGIFPQTLEEIKKLKGVGDYTASAIASFAYGISVPVVDGNVKRVVSRYMGIHEPIDAKEGIKLITSISEQAIKFSTSSGAYNQAIMNFGAVQCVPRNPNCGACPLQYDCQAFHLDLVKEIPQKIKKIKKRNRYFIFMHVACDDKILIQKRLQKDIWQQLYQMPLVEVEEKTFSNYILKKSDLPIDFSMKDLVIKERSEIYKQVLTHQRIQAQYLKFSMSTTREVPDKSYLWVSRSAMDEYAFPKVILDYLKDIGSL